MRTLTERRLAVPRHETQLSVHPREPRAVDLEFLPAGAWEYAIDPNTLAFHAASVAGGLPSPVFDKGKPPVTLSVSACPIDWPVAGDLFAGPPPENPVCLGAWRTLTLWPFGVGFFQFFVSGGNTDSTFMQ
jgi:hypothetical protein